MNKGSYFWKCAVMGLVGLLLLGFVTNMLWNWLVPTIFNGPRINYAQALGLLLLSKILTWGIWSRGHVYGGRYQNQYWKNQVQKKLSTLNPEEREAFKQKMKEKWCRWEQESSSAPRSND